MRLLGLIVVEDGVRSRISGGRVRSHALERIANRPIIEHVLEALKLAGVDEVLVASSSRHSNAIRESLSARDNPDGPPIRYVHREAPLEVTDALRMAAPIVGDAPCVVHLGTGILDESLTPFVDRLSDAPDVALLVHQTPGHDEHLSAATQRMLHLAEFSAEHALGMAGLWLFGSGALPLAAAAPWSVSGDVDLTMLGRRIAAAGGSFQVKLVDGWHQYRGDPLELLELNRIVLDRLDAGLRRAGNNGNRIEGRVWIHEAASVHASVIIGPTVIGPGARIADAYIGPYTSIGERARVEGAEVERSIISAGASVMHIGGRLVASVVGRDARVFRDFSLPRALRLRVGDGTEVALC
jgi:glucose-1-phosphate thymidylyltransferase